LLAKDIAAELGDHRDLSAKPGRHHGLIGAFAPEAELELLSGERFSWARQPASAKGQIDVCRTDDTDARSVLRHDQSLPIARMLLPFQSRHEPSYNL
jgi:hypothetical protein